MFQHCVQTILDDSENEVLAIFTWSEKAAHGKSRHSLLEGFQQKTGIPLIKVDTMNNPEAIQKLKRLKPDLIFVDGWAEKLSPEVLEAVPDRFVCLHPSLLPKARGGATLNWALIHGEKDWGITLFYLVQEIDKGDIIAQEHFTLEDRDDIQTAFEKATLAALDLLQRTLPQLRSGKADRRLQNHNEATFFRRRVPSQGEIDWSLPAQRIYNLIRALTRPYPGAFFNFNGRKVFVWKGYVEKEPAIPAIHERQLDFSSSWIPGKLICVIPGVGIKVLCSDGSLILTMVQPEGDPCLWADQWFKRYEIKEGVMLGAKSEVEWQA